ncbi:transposase [Streptomyces virginiae]|uniref:transposase n=1 Tax=Streptomyces virginiae TaxID=1961 RepID=UPI003430AC9A
MDTGCKWRALPADFPLWRTVWGFMARWAAAGIIGQIRDQPAGRIGRDMGKGPRPPSSGHRGRFPEVKAAETISKATRGYDAGKKNNGRKRHLVVDTRGLPLMVMVSPADLHDAAAAKKVLFRLRLMYPEITIVWADSAYAGKLVDWAEQHLNLTTAGQPSQGRLRLRRAAPPLGRREVARLDDARPPPRKGLRTTHPALRSPDHLGRHHLHDQASRPEERHAGPTRSKGRDQRRMPPPCRRSPAGRLRRARCAPRMDDAVAVLQSRLWLVWRTLEEGPTNREGGPVTLRPGGADAGAGRGSAGPGGTAGGGGVRAEAGRSPGCCSARPARGLVQTRRGALVRD